MTIDSTPLTIERTGGILRLAPRTDLVASAVEDLRAALLDAMAEPGPAVVLDLVAVEVLDSLGITLILGLFRSSQKAGAAFSIQNVRPDLMRVFRLFNLTKFFPVNEA